MAQLPRRFPARQQSKPRKSQGKKPAAETREHVGHSPVPCLRYPKKLRPCWVGQEQDPFTDNQTRTRCHDKALRRPLSTVAPLRRTISNPLTCPHMAMSWLGASTRQGVVRLPTPRAPGLKPRPADGPRSDGPSRDQATAALTPGWSSCVLPLNPPCREQSWAASARNPAASQYRTPRGR